MRYTQNPIKGAKDDAPAIGNYRWPGRLPLSRSVEVGLLDEILQRDAADEVVQAPPGGDMTDEEYPLPVPAQPQVAEEPADAGYCLPPAFPARIWPVQVLAPASVLLGHGHPVALPVVAFAQPPVIQHRDRGLAEGDGCCLGSAGQAGAEHGGDQLRRRAGSAVGRGIKSSNRAIPGQDRGTLHPHRPEPLSREPAVSHSGTASIPVTQTP